MSALCSALQPVCAASIACRMQQATLASMPARPFGSAATAASGRRSAQWQPRQRPSLTTASSSGSGSGGLPLSDEVLYSNDVPLSKLQAQLEAAVEDEDYETAAALRDVLQRRRFDVRLAVEEANERFYKAFQSGSLSAMSDVWGKGDHVQCIHPLGSCIAGRAAVMESWRAILGAGRLRITPEDVRIYATDSHAYVTCIEITETGDARGRIAATNIFEKQDGTWKLVHHHGSPAPARM